MYIFFIFNLKFDGEPLIYLHAKEMIKLLHSDAVISLPTFIIAECVLIYLDPDSSRAIVGWASKTFPTAIFFLYEQVGHFKLKAFKSFGFFFLSFVYFSGCFSICFFFFLSIHAPGLCGF